MSDWLLYVLRCDDDTLYTGITTDLQRRIDEHRAGTASKYTRCRLPVECLTSWRYADRSSASRAEHAFKKLDRAEKLAYVDRPSDWNGGSVSPSV